MNENLVKFKQIERDEINQSVQEFLNSGGTINKIEEKEAPPPTLIKTSFRDYIEI